MEKHELLKIIDDVLLEKLFGFCYARTSDSYEAKELCSDIVFALIKAANTGGSIDDEYAFIWRVARNVYADFCEEQKRKNEALYQGDPDDVLPFIKDGRNAGAHISGGSENDALQNVYRQIAFLSKAYREVMILFYIDGLSTVEIARRQDISETAVRQRLFSARKKVRNEVEKMSESKKIINKPTLLDKFDFFIYGTGDPNWGDPISVCERQFSKHVVWLCRKKPMSAAEIADRLNVPTIYVEEELEILTKGVNGEYGFLRRLDNGKYAINIILLDKNEIEKAHQIYIDQVPEICETAYEYIKKHKEEYIAFPYLNKNVNLNLIVWQQVLRISFNFLSIVRDILFEKYFWDVKTVTRPFSTFGYVNNGKYYGYGWDGVNAGNVCGYSKVHLENIYNGRIKAHFHCGHNVSNDSQLQLAIRAVEGLDINTLSESEKEHAAKAIECGYIYREGDTLYTKILVNDMKDDGRLFAVSDGILKGFFDSAAETVACKISSFIQNTVPEHLLNEWWLANQLACLPVNDFLIEALIEKGILTPPEDGIGAEGCWMSVEK